MLNRLIRAASLDSHLYEEVEADTTTLLPAMFVVVVVAISKGIATLASSGDFLVLVIINLIIERKIFFSMLYIEHIL